MTLNPHDTAIFLQNLGYQVDRHLKFKIREDERTPSASINKDGKIHDFGTGWHGDIVDFMVAFCGVNKRDAFARAKEFTQGGTFLSENFRPNFIPKFTQNSNAQTAMPYEKNESDARILAFKTGRELNQGRFRELLEKTIYSAKNGVKSEIDALLGYDATRDRLTMPIFNANAEVANFWAYNPNFEKYKVLFDKNRPREIFNLALLKRLEKSETIFICEGEKDALNALNVGIRAIGMPSCSSKIPQKDLELFRGRNFCVVFDCDESGRNGAIALKEQLKSVANVEILNLEKLAKEVKNEAVKSGYDFSDYIKDRQIWREKKLQNERQL